MQTIIFTENAASLRKRLEIDALVDWLRKPVETGGPTIITTSARSEFFRIILGAHNGLLKTGEEGGAGEQLAEVFGLDVLLSSQTIELLISALSRIPDYDGLQQNLGFLAFYSSLRQFQSAVDATVSLLHEERIPRPEEGTAVLELEVPGDAGYPSAQRFGDAIQQVLALHEALARYVLGRRDELVVLYLDSGGPLLVGFQCNDQLVKRIREMFASAVWGMRFNKNQRFEQNVDSAIAALDILGELDKAVQEDRLGESDAEVTKRTIARSMRALITAGVSPRNMILEEEVASEVLSEVREPLMLEAGEGLEPDDEEDAQEEIPEDEGLAISHLVWRRPSAKARTEPPSRTARAVSDVRDLAPDVVGPDSDVAGSDTDVAGLDPNVTTLDRDVADLDPGEEQEGL